MENEAKILKNPFGLNIAIPKLPSHEVKKTNEQEEKENKSVNPFIEYFEENDKVFSGEVANEISKYQAQIYSLGQIMRSDEPIRTFNTNV